MWFDATEPPATRSPGEGWDAVSQEVRVRASNGQGEVKVGAANYNSDTAAWALSTAVFPVQAGEWRVVEWAFA